MPTIQVRILKLKTPLKFESRKNTVLTEFWNLIGGMPQNITYFCGVVQDKTDDITLKEGAVSDTMSGGIEIYVKYCQANLCNAGNPLTNPFALTLLLFAAVVFLW